MSKPLAGRRAFEAMGRSARSRGLTIWHGRSVRIYWPLWARQAWAEGYYKQASKRAAATTNRRDEQ